MIGREDEVRDLRQRMGIFYIALGIAWGILFLRLVYLQVIKGVELRAFSETNRLKKEKLFPPRGLILDRDGHVIVENRAAFDVVLLPQYYSAGLKRGQLKEINVHLKNRNVRLAKALKMNLSEIEEKVARIPYAPKYLPILLKSDASKDVVAAIETDVEGFPGVDIEVTVQRKYPFGDVGAQMLGYIREVDPADIKKQTKKNFQPGDLIGKNGIEKMFDSELRGENGFGYVEVDASGRRRKTEGGEQLLSFVARTPPVAGNNLTLTIDIDLQLAAAQSMRARKYNGAVVAVDPRNGEVLAMVSEPSFDPSKMGRMEAMGTIWREISEGKDKPLLNRAMQGMYPPGSTFKLFMAMSALQHQKTSRSSSTYCNGGFHFGNRRFSCWKTHGPVDFIKSIRESCDVFFYNIGANLDVDAIAQTARMFGLGRRTELGRGPDGPVAGMDFDYYPESPGLIPDREWKQRALKQPWYPGETISIAIGQGYLTVTPIQMAVAYAALGNGGFMYRPFIVKKVENSKGGIIHEYKPVLRPKVDASPQAFEAVKRGLWEVVNQPGGTAYVAGRSKMIEISGKTGTAQVRGFSDIMRMKCEVAPIKDRHHGWFVGYAPPDNPEIAVAVLAEHSCHGTAAAPVVRDVIEAYQRKKHGEPPVVMSKIQERAKVKPVIDAEEVLDPMVAPKIEVPEEAVDEGTGIE